MTKNQTAELSGYEKTKWVNYITRKAKTRLKSSVFTKEEFCHLFGVSSPEELNTQEIDFLRSMYLSTIALGQNPSDSQREEYVLQYKTIHDARVNNSQIYDLYNMMKSNIDALYQKMDNNDWFGCDVYANNIVELSETNIGNGYARIKLKELGKKIGKIIRYARKDILEPPKSIEYRMQLIDGVQEDPRDKRFIDEDDEDEDNDIDE